MSKRNSDYFFTGVYIRNAYVVMFGDPLSPQTAASLGRMVILR